MKRERNVPLMELIITYKNWQRYAVNEVNGWAHNMCASILDGIYTCYTDFSNTAHTHTMAKGPSNKNFCHSMSFSILWGGKKPKKNELFLGNEGNYDHERNFIHEYDLNL